jgi:hypothetical protein
LARKRGTTAVTSRCRSVWTEASVPAVVMAGTLLTQLLLVR